ncbi:MAG: Vacuolar protein sorting-associated protein 62 [Thelocarpon impressellum]|nr:MAG: Vacuolar protein sorting-associated protein 62 [Thelocarpon impressellum]
MELLWQDRWSGNGVEGKVLGEIPSYVLDHAPLVHLYSGEQYWPCDMAEHLLHTTPHLNYTPLQSQDARPTLSNLDLLNQWDGGHDVYLQSDDDVETRPDWLIGDKNTPSGEDEETRQLRRPQYPYASTDKKKEGYSEAPAVVVVIDKGHGVIDAFWFFFYSFNLGNEVLNVRFGNHIGDWEHTLVRFVDGKPSFVFLSEHFFGEAYKFEAVEKRGQRPIVYSAVGSHAMYATAGVHSYILPLGLLADTTDAGPLWDPAQNIHAYTYDTTSHTLLPSTLTPNSPTAWFHFNGHWGDNIYPASDPRQYEFVGNYHYVSGPLGPKFKDLARQNVCQGSGECEVRDHLDVNTLRMWPERAEEEL